MSGADTGAGRSAQRRRTRAAIVTAAMGLLRAGGARPGVNDVARAADVSRRTVYQYFPTLDHLLLDATAGLLAQDDVDTAIDGAGVAGGAEADDPDVGARIQAMIRAVGAATASTMPLGRSLIRLTVDPPTGADAAPSRGFRRIAWIERALQPLRPQLDDDLFEQLVSGLAMVLGWEARVVLSDLRGLTMDEQQRTSTWAADALVAATLAEQARRIGAKTVSGEQLDTDGNPLTD